MIWWSIGWTSLKPISYSARTFLPNFCHCQACNPTVIFFWITWLYHMAALWLTSVDLHDIMYIVEHLTTGPSDVIAPVGITLSRHLRLAAKLWVLKFWIKFATIQAKNASKCSHLVSCNKQKMARVCFLSGKPLVWYFHTRAVLLFYWTLFMHVRMNSPTCIFYIIRTN
jgi:hypothetical protein